MRVLDKILYKAKLQVGGVLAGKVIKKEDSYFENPDGTANNPTIDENKYTGIDKTKIISDKFNGQDVKSYNYKGVEYLLDYKPSNMKSYGEMSATYTKPVTPVSTTNSSASTTIPERSNPKFMPNAHFSTDMTKTTNTSTTNTPPVSSISTKTNGLNRGFYTATAKAKELGIDTKPVSVIPSVIGNTAVQQSASNNNTQPTPTTTTEPEKRRGLFNRIFGQKGNKVTSDKATPSTNTETTTTNANNISSSVPKLPASLATKSTVTTKVPTLATPPNNSASTATTSTFDPTKINIYTLNEMSEIVDENGNVISFNSENERKAASELFWSTNKDVKEIPNTSNPVVNTTENTIPNQSSNQSATTNNPVVIQSQVVPSNNSKDISRIPSKIYEGNIPTIGRRTDNVDGKYTIKTGLKTAADEGAAADNEFYIGLEPKPYGLSPGKLIKPDSNGDMTFSKEYEGVVLKKDGSIYKDGKLIKKLTDRDNGFVRDYIATDNHQLDMSTEEKNLLAKIYLKEVLGDEVLSQYPELQQVNSNDLKSVNTNKSNRSPVSNIYNDTKTYKLNNEGIIVDDNENPVEFKTDADYNKAYNSIWNNKGNANNIPKQTINSNPSLVTDVKLPTKLETSTSPQPKPVPVIDMDAPIKPKLTYPAQQPANVQTGVPVPQSQSTPVQTPVNTNTNLNTNESLLTNDNNNQPSILPEISDEGRAKLLNSGWAWSEYGITPENPKGFNKLMRQTEERLQEDMTLHSKYSQPNEKGYISNPFLIQHVLQTRPNNKEVLKTVKVWNDEKQRLVSLADLPEKDVKYYTDPIERQEAVIKAARDRGVDREIISRDNWTHQNRDSDRVNLTLTGEERARFSNMPKKEREAIREEEHVLFRAYDHMIPAPGAKILATGMNNGAERDNNNTIYDYYVVNPKYAVKNIDANKRYTYTERDAASNYHSAKMHSYDVLLARYAPKETAFQSKEKLQKKKFENDKKVRENSAKWADMQKNYLESTQRDGNTETYTYDMKRYRQDQKRKKEYRKKQGFKNQSGGYINKTSYRFI